MTAPTWPDVAEALELAQHGPGAFEHNLLRAVSAMVELLAPPAGLDAAIEEAIADAQDQDRKWPVTRRTRKFGRGEIQVTRDADVWWVSMSPGIAGIGAFHPAYLSAASAMAAVDAWLSEHQS